MWAYRARRKASARSSSFPPIEPNTRGANSVALSTAAILFSLCVPRWVLKNFLMVPAWTSMCLLYDRHCKTVWTMERHEDSLILLSTNCRSITTMSARCKMWSIRSQKAEMASNAV